MLFLLIGWMRRAVILGAKLDECQACHVAGPHLILRRSNWFTIFRVPIILLWLSHGLLCPECGDYKPLGFMQVRRALKSGRLPLDRQRPAYEAAVHELVGGTSPADWATIGLEPDATPDALKARWHELAKTNHPDHGGDTQTFVRMQAAYRRLSTAPSTDVGFVPDPKDLFDPIVKNPKRGFFDAYLKVWPVLAAIVLASAALSPHPAAGSSGTVPVYQTPVVAGGTAHICWESGGELVGCQDDTTDVMLFGTKTGSQVVCVFPEPFLEGQLARCRDV